MTSSDRYSVDPDNPCAILRDDEFIGSTRTGHMATELVEAANRGLEATSIEDGGT